MNVSHFTSHQVSKKTNQTKNSTMILTTGEEVTLAADGSIVFRDGLSNAEWYEVHRRLMHTKEHASKWLKQSREYGTNHYGLDYVAEAEVQIEMDLGFVAKDKPATLNPPDKTKAIINIEGIHQSFVLWERKMHDEIETWGSDKLTRALELLEPMERQARAIRERLAQ